MANERSTAIFVVITALFSSLLWDCSAPVLAESWLSLGRGTERDKEARLEAFIDMDSIRRFDDSVRFTKKTIYDTEQTTPKGIPFKKFVVTIIIDCSRRLSATVTVESYDHRSKKTFAWCDRAWEKTGAPLPGAFTPILPGSSQDRARKRLCGFSRQAAEPGVSATRRVGGPFIP